MRPHLVVIGNPNCRRVAFWHAAAARLGWSGFEVVAYADLLRTRTLDALPAGAVVRIETPGGDWDTYKLLLKFGRDCARDEAYPALDDDAVERIAYERGWLVRPRQAHLGYLRLLQMLEPPLCHSDVDRMQTSADIADCFDKSVCQARLARHDVPIPQILGSPRCYDELRSLLRGERRVMVKLAHGSGAAGCLAIHYGNGRANAITTVAQLQVHGEPRLYHSKRPIYLAHEAEIAALVDRLGVEGLHAEAWLPKMRWQDRNIDLRVVTIDGVPRHTVVRSSTSVFTNLTLGGARGNLAALIERIGPDAWQAMRASCANAARAFPESFTLGIDLLIRPDGRRHAVLEVNAFGDLLLHQLDQGEDTYTATLNAWQRCRLPEAAAS